MQTILQVQAKAIGKKRPLVPDWGISVPDGWMGGRDFSLRALITLVIRQEVAAFEARQAERSFLRVLTDRQIADAARKGKVDAAVHAAGEPVDEGEAVETALQAFADGFYYVFVDDLQIEHLHTAITLSANSRILFLRLVPLMGG